jgi:PAS domain S-box-containing protein
VKTIEDTSETARHEERWSANLCALLGLDPWQTRFAEDDFWELVHPEERGAVSAIIERAMSERKPYEYPARFLLRDGSERVLLTRGSMVFDSAGRAFKRVGVRLDITEGITAERALRQSEERYRDLVENSTDLICLHDLQGCLL